MGRLLDGARIQGDALERINRLAVLAATICAVPFAVALVAIGLATGRDDVMAGSITPGVVAVVGFWQLRRPDPKAVYQLVAGGAMTTVYMRIVDTASHGGAMAALVTIGMTGILFLQRYHGAYIGGFAAAIVLNGYWLESTPTGTDRLLAATGQLLLFLFAALLVLWLRRELEVGHARYRSLFERAPVGIWEADFSAVEPWLEERRNAGVTDLAAHFAEHPDQGTAALNLVRVLDVNRAGVALVGALRKHKLLGAVRAERLDDGFREVGLRQIVGLWNGTGAGQCDIGAATIAGKRLDLAVSWTAPQVRREPDLTSLVTTIADVTKLKRAEQRLARLVESKDEFIASVSHELRTPLTAIVGLSLELQDRFGSYTEDERAELIALIADQSSEMAYIVEDLLVTARPAGGDVAIRPEEFDVRAEVARVLRDLGPEAAAIDAHLDVGRSHPLTWGDPARTRQVLRNLFVNAVRHGGGHVRVEVSGRAATLVEVRDDGDPIPAPERDAIFDAYHRSPNSGGLVGSVGLGLTVSRRLAQSMGGDVSYRHDGAESIFTLRLPVAAPTGGAGAAATPSGPSARPW